MHTGVTSLKPVNLQNKPDVFERASLTRLEQMNNVTVIRLHHPDRKGMKQLGGNGWKRII